MKYLNNIIRQTKNRETSFKLILACILTYFLFPHAYSYSSVIGDEYQIDSDGILSGSFSTGFIQEEYVTQIELGNGGDGASNTPVVFGNPKTVSGWIRPFSAANSFITPGSIFVQDSLTTINHSTSILRFDVRGYDSSNPASQTIPLFTNTLQHTAVPQRKY